MQRRIMFTALTIATAMGLFLPSSPKVNGARHVSRSEAETVIGGQTTGCDGYMGTAYVCCSGNKVFKNDVYGQGTTPADSAAFPYCVNAADGCKYQQGVACVITIPPSGP